MYDELTQDQVNATQRPRIGLMHINGLSMAGRKNMERKALSTFPTNIVWKLKTTKWGQDDLSEITYY